ncbi:kinase-like domain-containing protein [Gloeopeniophorella convolvens]|nr:kinase-like domain-containing protein [Gloeopeniophorella convolvens]
MRLYKPKTTPQQQRITPDSPPSTSPGKSPHLLKRAAEAVSKQLAEHKAKLSLFKESSPRAPVLSTKFLNVQHTLRAPPSKPISKTVKAAGKPPSIPAKALTSYLAPTSTANLVQRQGVSQSPAKPPGLGSTKAISVTELATPPRALLNKPRSPFSLNRFPLRKADVKSVTSPTKSVSVTSTNSECDPAIPIQEQVSDSVISTQEQAGDSVCFKAQDDDSKLEDDDLGLDDDDFAFGAESGLDIGPQVAHAFSFGLGPVYVDEVVRRGVVPPPVATPEVTLDPIFESMSASVEWWEPETNPPVEPEATPEVESKVEAADFQTIPLDDMTNTNDVTPLKTLFRPPSPTDFRYVSQLGQGSFGVVSLGIHKHNGRRCAIKVICKDAAKEKKAIHTVIVEQRVMREVSGHPLLLGLLASFHDSRNFYLVSDYCRSTLSYESKYMSESDKKFASAELACAVDHLHGLGIVHRDIKLDNVMMKIDGHIVLGDFGLAYRLEEPKSLLSRFDRFEGKDNGLKPTVRGICGTFPYMAPEMLRNMEYSYGVDWFGYGVSLHLLYLNRFPWLGEQPSPESFLGKMTSTLAIGLLCRNGVLKDLLNKLFCIDQLARADFLAIQRNPFFADIEWQKILSMNTSPSYIPRKPGPRLIANDDETKSFIGDVSSYPIEEDPYPGFAWATPSMVVEDSATSDTCEADTSFDSNGDDPHTQSRFATSFSEEYLAPRGPLRIMNPSPPPSPRSLFLSQSSSCGSFTEDDEIEALRNSVRALDEGEEPVYQYPALWLAAFADSGVCIRRSDAARAAREAGSDDEAYVCASIKSLDDGERPVFEAPPGWKDAFASPQPQQGFSAPSTPSQPILNAPAKNTVLGGLKSLWKRAAGKVTARQA